MIDYVWKNGKWCYKSKTETPGEVTVRVDKGHREVIERLEPCEARETVGAWIALDGNTEKQAEIHKEKTLAFSAQMNRAKLMQSESRDAVETTIMKTLEYPMEAVTLSEQQWRSIMWPIWKTMLPKMGINRYFP